MLFILAALACSTPEPAQDGLMIDPNSRPPEPEAKVLVLPEGNAITRECFAAAKGDVGRRSRPLPSSAPSSGAAPAPKRPQGPTASTTPSPAPASPAMPDPSAVASVDTTAGPQGSLPEETVASNQADGGLGTSGAGRGGGGALGGGESKLEDLSPAAEKSAPAADRAPEPAPVEVTKPVVTESDSRAEPKMAAKHKEEKAAPRGLLDDEALKRAGPSEAELRRARLDWGGTTWLSNDDSMSLASAQRLLWAVQNKAPVTTAEVRPHELLNYFSFDTTDVAPGDTFSVFGTAERLGDGKLGLALAVKGVIPERRPLDVTLVLDRSGSMWAEGRMDYLKRGLRTMEGRLVRGDRVDVVLFDDELCTPLEDYVVGRDDPELLDTVITKLEPRGSTDLDAGLREGYRIANARSAGSGERGGLGRNRRMLLISDALLNEGELDESVVSEIGKAYSNSGIRLSAIGVGRTFNDKVLDMLSEKGKGAYVYLGSEAVVDRIFGPGFDSLTETIANDVHFGLDLPDSLAIERFYGEESSTVKADVQPIDYYAGTTQLFLQDLALRDPTPVPTDRILLTLEWTDPVTGAARSKPYSMTIGELLASDHHNLRKGRALMAWTDLVLARTLHNDPCAEPYTTWDTRVRALGPDAELAWLDGITAPLCGRAPVADTLVARSGVPLKVRVDADQTIAEVGLRCGGDQQTATLSGNIAIFSAEPGKCELVLQGTVPMTAQVEVPKTGGDLRCVLRGGKLSCG